MSSDFAMEVAKQTKRLVDTALVRETLGPDAGIDRLPEAKLRLLLKHLQSALKILRIAGLCLESFNADFATGTTAQQFLEVVGGVKAAIDSLPTNESLGANGLLMTEADAKRYIKEIGWRHYVYGLCLKDGTVFYVGKGVQDRMLQHKAEAKSGAMSAKCLQILEAGDDLRYTVFLSCQDDAFAAGYESHLILRHSETLTNVASGSQKLVEQMFTGINVSVAEHKKKAIDLFHGAADEVRQAQRRIAKLLVENKGLMDSMSDADVSLFSLRGVSLK